MENSLTLKFGQSFNKIIVDMCITDVLHVVVGAVNVSKHYEDRKCNVYKIQFPLISSYLQQPHRSRD